MRVILITLVILFYSSSSYADGNSLLSQCKVALEMMDDKHTNGSSLNAGLNAGLCLGTIRGMRHMNSFYEFQLSKKETYFCTPEKAQASQLLRIVINYLKNNPAKLHEHEASLVLYALADAYPCQ